MFQYFDLDKKGAISPENIKETFARCGNKISKEGITSMINDLNPIGEKMSHVTLEMFFDIMSAESFQKPDLDIDTSVQNNSIYGEGRRTSSQQHLSYLPNGDLNTIYLREMKQDTKKRAKKSDTKNLDNILEGTDIKISVD